MSETTDASSHAHLQPVREGADSPAPTPATPVRQSGGHMTGLLALLLAVAVFAFLAQFSANQDLQGENQALRDALAGSQAEVDAGRGQMTQARDALGGLRNALVQIEGLLMPPPEAAAPAEAAPAAE